MNSSTMYVGIDPSGGRKPFTWAVFDSDGKLASLVPGELDEVMAFLEGLRSAVVAVNAPPGPNIGLVRRKLEQQGQLASHMRGVDLRLAEYLLRERGIQISATPSRADLCSEWTRSGFELYRRLDKMGFKLYPSVDASHQVLETHPQAAFSALLGQSPLPKPTLEGRLQRQLILFEQDLGIKDPMDFFEEITRHRLMHGILPVESVYASEELDALIAGFVAFVAGSRPDVISLHGAMEEGQIALPVGELKERY